MTSTAGSTMPSASRVKRAAVVLHGRPEALGSGLARLESVAKQEGVELVLVAGDAQPSAGRGRGGDRARRRRHDAAGPAAVPGHRGSRWSGSTSAASDSSARSRGTSWRAGVARVFGGELRGRRAANARRRGRRGALRRRQRRRRHERRARAHGGARVVDRRRGFRPRPVRRADLLDAVRLDRLQPLERRGRC